MNSRVIFRRLCEQETGSALIDFALSVPIAMCLMLGVMDSARILYADHYVASSARLAARYAMVHGATWKGTTCTSVATYNCAATAGDVTNFVKSFAPPGIRPDGLTVETTWTGTTPAGAVCDSTNGVNSPGCVVKVKVSYAFDFVFSLLPQGTITLNHSTAIGISQ